MWETDPKSFSARFGLTDCATLHFRCTAEHLEARCDGGLNTKENVVAACRYCNGNRHKRKRPKDAVSYMELVRSRMKQGRWLPVTLIDSPYLDSNSWAQRQGPAS
ncbi:HNH endonuclease [Rhizobium pisi]|uniref:HNH endonuclease n=1 Tax=Rhizobium pisi TaxID=574561 RepID=UPI0039AFC11D